MLISHIAVACVLCWWTEYRTFLRRRHHSVLPRKPQTVSSQRQLPATSLNPWDANPVRAHPRQHSTAQRRSAARGAFPFGPIPLHPPPTATQNSCKLSLPCSHWLSEIRACSVRRPAVLPESTTWNGRSARRRHCNKGLEESKSAPIATPPRLALADANVMPMPAQLRQAYRYNASNTPRNPSPRIDRHKLPSALPAALQAGLSSAAHPS